MLDGIQTLGMEEGSDMLQGKEGLVYPKRWSGPQGLLQAVPVNKSASPNLPG